MEYEKSKNICFVNSCNVWGGGEKWLRDTALRLKDDGYNVFVITNVSSVLYDKLGNNVKLFRVAIGNLSFLNVFKIIKMFLIFRRNKISVVILGLSSDVKIGGIAAKLAGVKKIIYRRGTALPVKNSLLNRFVFKNILTDIIVNSIDIKNKLLLKNKNIFPESNLHIIYNGVLVPNRNKFMPAASETILLGNSGRFVEQKGQKYLIEMAHVLKERGVSFIMKITGDGKLKNKLIQYSKKLRVDDVVQFIEFTDDIDGFMNEIDIFCMSSLHEGTSNVMLEAMASGKPVVAFKISSMPEIISDGVNGFLVEFPNMQLFADKVMQLMKDGSLRQRMGNEALNTVKEKFDFEEKIRSIKSIINT